MSALQRHADSAPLYGRVGTSAAGAMLGAKHSASTVRISSYWFIDNTFSDARLDIESLHSRAAYPVIFFVPLSIEHWQSAPVDKERTKTNEATRTAITELRRLSGLTWDQLARLFGVSRRSVHLWVSGKPMNAQNEERLHRILALLKDIDRGSADENRKLLLTPTDGGQRPIDLLAEEEYEKVRETLGPGIGRHRPKLTPLSAGAWGARLPPKPEQLVDARHEPIHKEPGEGRAARVKRTTG